MSDTPKIPATEVSEAEIQKRIQEALDAQARQFKEATSRRAGVLSFIQDLEGQGRITPAMKKAGLTEFLDYLEQQEGVIITFAEGGSKTPGATFREILAALPKLLEFRELAGASTDPGTDNKDQRQVDLGLAIARRVGGGT